MSSTKNNHLSLCSAIIINLNIIIGSGVFINTTELAKRAGLLGGLCYALVGLLLLPLILSFVRLLQFYPSGGFYSFCSTSLHPLVGFINTWCYFFAKLSSATLVIHIFTLLLQKTFPTLNIISPMIFNIGILVILLALNMLNVRTGSRIQGWLMIIKLFPLFFVIVSGLFFLQSDNLTPIHQLWSGLPSAMPLVLHALLGFEVACAISRNIENPEVNGPRSILISYGIVIVLYVVYQSFFYGILGTELAQTTNYSGAFPLLISKFGISDYYRDILGHLIHLAIATSALSAGFGMIYANMWNLYSLAERKHTIAPAIIVQRNRFNVPFICVLAQGIIMLAYMFIMCGAQTTFQQLSAFGTTITYVLSIAGLYATLRQKNYSLLLPTMGFINCGILITASLYAMWQTNNPIPLYILMTIITCGIIIYGISEKSSNNLTQF
ncbi:MAG TPA: APC family permease [Candidatus Babeliales bacterium]|jgi:amino acid transporter|nr:APC family permease [Candidatus Babeliales bacterium]